MSTPSLRPDTLRLRDEVEQLRTALEETIEQNERLARERDQLLHRISCRSHTGADAPRREPSAAGPPSKPRAETEEELRVAYEELQVLTEELEVANASLLEANHLLDRRVEQRTRELLDANAALRATEASFRALADLVPELLWRADASGAIAWFNQRWFDYTGQEEASALGDGWLDAVHPVDRARTRVRWTQSLESGERYENELRIREVAGGYRWFMVRAEPLLGEDGRVVRWFGASTDIHAQRTALEALRKSELRFRTLVEGMPPLAWRAVDGGKWTWSSPRWREHTGQREADALADGWLDAVHPDDRAAARAAWVEAQQSGLLEIEGRIFHAATKRYRHFRTRALPVRGESGRIVEWLGTSTDVDDIVRLQGEQTVLMAELQHRTRNLMGVVQAVTLRTLKSSGSLQDFRSRIDDRLSALARVQGLLSRRDSGTRVAFDTLLREELSAHVELDDAGCSDQVRLDGPAGVPLRSAMVQSLALAIHELTTNALKYGALSQPGARLHVTWLVRNDPDGTVLCVDWRESGVADMPQLDAAPRGSGSGRELIERALPYQLGARTSYGFADDGVHCTIEVQVNQDDMPEGPGLDNAPLQGYRILVMEDEFLLADELAEELAGAGALVIGPLPSVAEGTLLLASGTPIDFALLDVNLGGEMVFPVADTLRTRDVPFAFATGYDRSVLPERFADAPRIEKPFKMQRIVARLAPLLTAQDQGSSSDASP